MQRLLVRLWFRWKLLWGRSCAGAVRSPQGLRWRVSHSSSSAAPWRLPVRKPGSRGQDRGQMRHWSGRVPRRSQLQCRRKLPGVAGQTSVPRCDTQPAWHRCAMVAGRRQEGNAGAATSPCGPRMLVVETCPALKRACWGHRAVLGARHFFRGVLVGLWVRVWPP